MSIITYEDYLAHFGVKGMKWGRRKASKGAQKLSNKLAKGHSGFEAIGRKKLAKTDGKAGSAYARAAGKAAAIHFATNIGANLAVGALQSNPGAQAAVAVGARAIKAVNVGILARDTVGIHTAAKNKK